MSSCTLLLVLVTVILSSHNSAMLLISCHILFFYKTVLVHILYFPIIFIYCIFHILYFHMFFIYFIYHLHFVSLILYFLYLYTCHILLDFMSANTLEADTGNNYMYS